MNSRKNQSSSSSSDDFEKSKRKLDELEYLVYRFNTVFAKSEIINSHGHSRSLISIPLSGISKQDKDEIEFVLSRCLRRRNYLNNGISLCSEENHIKIYREINRGVEIIESLIREFKKVSDYLKALEQEEGGDYEIEFEFDDELTPGEKQLQQELENSSASISIYAKNWPQLFFLPKGTGNTQDLSSKNEVDGSWQPHASPKL